MGAILNTLRSQNRADEWDLDGASVCRKVCPERKSGIYQMFGVNRAYRFGEWKIVSKGGCRWELYNMALDPTEQNDLAAQHPERVDTLKAMWWTVAIEDERLPPQVNKMCSDEQAKPRRFIMRQGNQRVPPFKGS